MDRNKKRLLIVDDNEQVRVLLPELFNSYALGGLYTTACSGNDAIELIQQGISFDLIICDLNMPDGDGKVVFDFTQTSPYSIPFILYTSATDVAPFKGTNFLGSVEKSDFRSLMTLISQIFFGNGLRPTNY